MRILHAGNMANAAYVICRQLRKTGIDVELLMDKYPYKNSNPLLFDPKLNNEFPEWIKFFDKKKFLWKLNLIKKLRRKEFDLIHAYVELPIFAFFANKLFIAQTQGSDFRELAVSNSIKGILLRLAYKKAKVILFFQPDHLPIFSKLNLNNGIFLPPAWDTSFFHAKKNEKENSEFVVFHPANLEYRLKGNNKLLEGFAMFVKNNSNSKLVIVDRGIDSKNTHELVKKLGIEENVEFIKGPLNSEQLLEQYNKSDIVADQFVLGSLGSIAWETFSIKKPLLAFVNEKEYTDVYGEPPPIANAFSSIQISEKLNNLQDIQLRKKIGNDGYNWLAKHHSPEIFTKKLLIIYDYVIKNKSINQLREELSKIN